MSKKALLASCIKTNTLIQIQLDNNDPLESNTSSSLVLTFIARKTESNNWARGSFVDKQRIQNKPGRIAWQLGKYQPLLVVP